MECEISMHAAAASEWIRTALKSGEQITLWLHLTRFGIIIFFKIPLGGDLTAALEGWDSVPQILE